MFKTTKIALTCILTLIATYLFIVSIAYLFSDANVSFKDCTRYGGVYFTMLFFGYIPSAIIGYDMDAYLSEKS